MHRLAGTDVEKHSHREKKKSVFCMHDYGSHHFCSVRGI